MTVFLSVHRMNRGGFLQCVHMRSVGNDFMVVDGRNQRIDGAAMAQKACALTGADGFMVLGSSEIADFGLAFYNCDGSRASMCGNGSRCICCFAYSLGLVGGEMTVQTDAGVIFGRRISEDIYGVLLPAPEKLCLGIEPGVDYCICGVPHGVLSVAEIQKEALYQKAQALRQARDCNVDFYRWLDSRSVQVLTYERGVEDFTLACGTGCGAVAAILYHTGRLPGKDLTAQCPGGELRMKIAEENGHIRGIFQEGRVETLGTYLMDI